MSAEKIVLIFALFGSAYKVFEVLASMFASASAERKSIPGPFEKVIAPAVEPTFEQTPVASTLEAQLSRITMLLEDQTLAAEDMKDKYEELSKRLAKMETQKSPSTPAAPKPAPRVRKPAASRTAPASQPAQVVELVDPEGRVHQEVGQERFEML